MKKSTILILILVFLGSILAVGIFGMQSIPFEERVYSTSITPTSVMTSTGNELEIKKGTDEDGKNFWYVTVSYEEGLIVMISYDLQPSDCTNKKVEMTIVEPQSPAATISERGEIVFHERGSVHVLFKAKDSQTGASMDFWIYVKS